MIASSILGYPLVNQKADFFTFRHTGATNIAQMASNREELMRVVNMVGIRTWRPSAEDDQVIDRWELPNKLPPTSCARSDLTNVNAVAAPVVTKIRRAKPHRIIMQPLPIGNSQ